MVLGKLFSPGAEITQKEGHPGQFGKSVQSQARTELDDPESKNLKRRLSSNNQKIEEKSPDIQVQIFKRNIMMKQKAYVATMMKTRYQRKRRTCKSLETKVTQVQNDFLPYKGQ